MSVSGSASLIPRCTAYKLLWDKTDRQEYENTFNCILTQNMDKSEEDAIDKKLDYLTRVMCETAEQIVPKRLIRLDGFKWKASSKSLFCLFIVKK
jgi:hypothetical protein